MTSTIVLLAIFKNESHILEEWIKHYINEGIDKFILIDNNSSDKYELIISPYINLGLVTLIKDKRMWSQIIQYNDHIDKCKMFDWLITCDLDEFIYSRKNFKTIKCFLNSLDNNVAQICIPWKMFGSNNYNTLNKKQPKNVVSNFTRRANYITHQDIPCKSIVRTKYLKKIGIHEHYINRGIYYNNIKNTKNYIRDFVESNENILNNSYLHCNHYCIQSLDWFMRIKVTRGDATDKAHHHIRNMEYFKKYDTECNNKLDIELTLKLYNCIDFYKNIKNN